MNEIVKQLATGYWKVAQIGITASLLPVRTANVYLRGNRVEVMLDRQVKPSDRLGDVARLCARSLKKSHLQTQRRATYVFNAHFVEFLNQHPVSPSDAEQVLTKLRRDVIDYSRDRLGRPRFKCTHSQYTRRGVELHFSAA